MLCKQGLVLLSCKLCQSAHVGALQAALCCSSAKCSNPEPPQPVERQQWGLIPRLQTPASSGAPKGEQQQSCVSSAREGLGLPGQCETSAGWLKTERATRIGSINTLTGNNGECKSGPYQRRKQKPDNAELAGVADAGLVPAVVKMLLLTRFSMDVSSV